MTLLGWSESLAAGNLNNSNVCHRPFDGRRLVCLLYLRDRTCDLAWARTSLNNQSGPQPPGGAAP